MTRLRDLSTNANRLVNQIRGLLKGTEAKEIEAIIDTVVEMMVWLEETVETLKEEEAIRKAMILLNAGVRIIELLDPLIDLIEGDDTETPSWLAVLIPLIKKLRVATSGKQDD